VKARKKRLASCEIRKRNNSQNLKLRKRGLQKKKTVSREARGIIITILYKYSGGGFRRGETTRAVTRRMWGVGGKGQRKKKGIGRFVVATTQKKKERLESFRTQRRN